MVKSGVDILGFLERESRDLHYGLPGQLHLMDHDILHRYRIHLYEIHLRSMNGASSRFAALCSQRNRGIGMVVDTC